MLFLNDLIRRRLAALLRPWLVQEPELELKLGFLRSHVVVKNLSLDCSALNQSLDESARFIFKEFKVDELSLRISYWSVPTFKVEFSGVHVTLSAGEVTEGGGVGRKRKPTDTSLEDMRKLLAEIDPVGSALHDMMEKIMGASSRNQTTSFLNVMLQRCHFLMHEIHLVVQFPISNDSSCLFEVKELNADSQYIDCGCFLRGFISSIFVPLRETSFSLGLRSFEIGLKSKEHVSCVVSSTDLFTSMKLEDLQLIDFNLSVPEIVFSFSPLDFTIISAFNAISSSELKRTRNGKQLWRIAASRISSLVSTPRFLFHKMVGVGCLWLCYVHAYENLLFLAGYPVEKIIKQSAATMSVDGVFSRSFKNQWKVVSEIEKKLPAHAIAQARRITRSRVALNVQKDEDHLNQSLVNGHFKFFRMILSRLALVWNIICSIFCSIIYLFWRKVLDNHPKIDVLSRVVSEDFCPQRVFNLSMGKISIVLSPSNSIQPSLGGKLLSDIGISHSELLAFCCSIDMLFLTYTENICERYFCFSCGELKAVSPSISEDGSTSNEIASCQKGNGKRKVDAADAFLWSEPAKKLSAIDSRTSSRNDAEGTSVPFLENLFRQTWSKWEEFCTKGKGCEIRYSENPWILCEVKNFLTDQGLKNVNTGSWNCSLIVGKLNFFLGYLSILSVTVLLRQIQHALSRVHCGAGTNVLSTTQITSEDLPVIDRYKSYMEMTMLRVLPEKNIQIGVFITGPHIQISLEKEVFFERDAHVDHIVSQDNLHLAVDVHDIEFAVWPNLKFDMVASPACPGLGDSETECLRLMEPPRIDICQSDNEMYACRGQISLCIYLKVNGLNAFFDDPAQNQLYQIIILNPMVLQLSSLREDFHSFSTGIIAFSAALQGIFTGLTVLLFMDELFVLVKVGLGLFSAASLSSDLFGGSNLQDFTQEETIRGSEGTVVVSAKGTSFVSTLFVGNGTFKLKSIDMVLHNSRKKSINSRKLAMHSVPECGICTSVENTNLEFSYQESMIEVSSDFAGFRSVILKDSSEIGTISEQSELRNLLLQSQNCLHEVSISLCTFSLRLRQKVMEPPSNQWLLIKISVSEIYMAGCLVKNILVKEQNSNKLEFSLAVGREFRTITCQIQGGAIFLEIEVLPILLDCVASYLHFIRHLLNVSSSMECIISETGEGMHSKFQPVDWEQVEAFTGNFSQFSLVLVATDDTGTLQELLFEADFHLNVELSDRNKQLSSQLTRFSVLSQILHKTTGQGTSEIQIPHFDGAQEESSIDGAQVLHLSHQNYILKQLGASISVEKLVPGNGIGPLHLNQAWVGRGSVSGFDMRISLREIQMLLSTLESLSGVFSEGSSSNEEQTLLFTNQESYSSLEETVPDGAIVAIQDVHQHMYITVESVESKYNLVGAIHYSLVGERALFRVKYQNQRRWKSSVMWFSLISLYAKSDSGEPLRLNYRPGSSFVDISSTYDSGWALWRMLSCKPDTYEGDIELESYNHVAKNTFYLVNKKNDRAVAFVDGVPEFVQKPGNPFKWKLFNDLSIIRDVTFLGSLRDNSHVEEERTSADTQNLPHIVITVDKVAITIVDELLDTKEKFPLLQVDISSIDLILQILHAKARVLSSLSVVVYYFDAQRNLWEEFVHPVEVCVFYRSRFQIQGSGTVLHGVPVLFYARIKELGISITELSLDVLLFVIGKLNLAGPYAIRSAKIFANCCKVDNQSSLDLLCQFYDNQNASIARKQSSIIVLRHLALVNRPPEASYVSIQLAERGTFLTLPIHLSLLEAGAFTWRTRIVSLQDSKTYPGPFVVVDISSEIEDGLSVTVSPLLRIQNETEFTVELRFQRPQQKQAEFATVVLKPGDTIDDSTAAFDAISLSGGLKKALMSLSVGNFLFSFRPEIRDDFNDSWKLPSVEWSEYLGGGKAVRFSGLFDKLSYKFRKAFSVEPVRCSFSTARCSIKSEDGNVANVHFLIQCIARDVPLIQPDNLGHPRGNRTSPVALQEQKEIFLLPTVRVSNLLKSEIHVLLTDMDPSAAIGCDSIGKQATISCGSTVDLYANPATIYFIVTLTAFSSSCKPVNSSDWVKKLQKQKNDVHHLDINLDFGGGKYFAILRLSRGHRGILEVAIFTSYALENDTDFPLFCFAPNQKPPSRDEAKKLDFSIPPEHGYLLPPKSTRSWFIKYNKVRLKLLEEKASEILLDLDALSGLTEIPLEVEDGSGFKHVANVGVSLGPLRSKLNVPSQVISLVPRYIVLNESEEVITTRQCYLEDDMEGMIPINSKQKIALKLRSGTIKKREVSVFENFLRKHRDTRDNSLEFIQFRPNEAGLGWSGPVCVASLGRFFLKFRRSSDIIVQQSNQGTAQSNTLPEFAVVHVVEEGSSLVMHYHRPPNINLPYRIENCLHESFITYYQKDLLEPEILGAGNSVNYVWDDLTLPRKLVIQINDALREINLDKVREWKPFYRARQQRGLGLHLPLDQKRTSSGESCGMGIVNVGYEIYADGATRVLRICEFSGSHKDSRVFQSSGKIRLRISYFAIHLLEHSKKDIDAGETPFYSPIIVTRLENINLDSLFTNQHNYNQLRVQTLSVDQKWVGAPFAAMLRRQQLDYSDRNVYILHTLLVLLSSSSNVKQVKYSSVVLQPLALNLDEETLMRIVPFWRTSLSNSQSQQYYFDHFEIHPIKIVASFLPGDSYSSYSSTQEMLRSLLHSVIKIPAIKNKNVELNGVLVTHALITIRELLIKCAQHYSWYSMRAIYIAKGSKLLPPAFASIFDDSASSSLDVFFDPSSVLMNLPGLTIGTFKLISKCIDGKGFSGTKRYFGDLGKTVKTAGSNIVFAAVTEVSDSVLKGAETSGFNGMVSGFHQGILKLAMEPSLLGTAVMEGGPDRKIKLDRSPGVDELYIEGYLQAMLDTLYKQEYLRVRVIDNQVYLKNLPPNSSLIDEIVNRVKDFLVSKALLKGDSSTTTRPLRHLRGESEWRIGPTVLTLCEHLFVSFAIRMLRKQAGKFIPRINWKKKLEGDDQKAIVPASTAQEPKVKLVWKWEIGKFVLSGIVAYIDGRLCRSIPNPVARRIVSGFLFSFLDKNDKE